MEAILPNVELHGTLFTPSELVLLHGDRLIGPGATLDLDGLLPPAAYTAGDTLAETMLAVAVLANEAQGTVRLRIHPDESLAMERVHLYMDPAPGRPVWPTTSLETRICHLAQEEPVSISTLIYRLLPRTPIPAWQSVFEQTETSLRARGLLAGEPIALVGTGRMPLHLTEAAHRTWSTQPLHPVQALLAQAGHADARRARLLRAEIRLGLIPRTEVLF